MSYLTLEVEIDHGRIIPRDPGKLPVKGEGLLAIFQPTPGGVPASAGEFPLGGLSVTKRREPRPIGLAKGEFVVPDHFNAPLPDDIQRWFEGQ